MQFYEIWTCCVTKVLVAGWGRTNNNIYDRGDIGLAGAYSRKLKKLELSLVEMKNCTQKYDYRGSSYDLRGIDRNKQICAGGTKGK